MLMKNKSSFTHIIKNLIIFQHNVSTVHSPIVGMFVNLLNSLKAQDHNLFWTLFIQQSRSKFNKKANLSINKIVKVVGL